MELLLSLHVMQSFLKDYLLNVTLLLLIKRLSVCALESQVVPLAALDFKVLERLRCADLFALRLQSWILSIFYEPSILFVKTDILRNSGYLTTWIVNLHRAFQPRILFLGSSLKHGPWLQRIIHFSPFFGRIVLARDCSVDHILHHLVAQITIELILVN